MVQWVPFQTVFVPQYIDPSQAAVSVLLPEHPDPPKPNPSHVLDLCLTLTEQLPQLDHSDQTGGTNTIGEVLGDAVGSTVGEWHPSAEAVLTYDVLVPDGQGIHQMSSQ